MRKLLIAVVVLVLLGAGADFAATDATARGINAAQLRLTLHGVRVPRDVMLGEPGRISVDRADGTIELNGVEVRSQVQFLGQSLDALVTGELGARDGGVSFTPEEIRLGELGRIDPSQGGLASRFTFQVPLPELPAGVRLERVDTRPGTVVLSGRAAAVRVAA